ncbi:hypothetical protein [Massilia antarctica]|uniref:hypothetical protein n=1 Tax=Massilia antarctica TaxID=2765360 RepID=UPI00226F353E|nr:hypothetical protein [Massilia sp. H27-R4]MCY0914038.1 hypothetical protein [Massilia sp. H27-R4]
MNEEIVAQLDRSAAAMASKRATRALEEEDVIIQGKASVRRLATCLAGMGADLRGRIRLKITVPPTGAYVDVQLRRPWSFPWEESQKYRLSPSSSADPDKLALLPLLDVLAGHQDLPKYEAYVVEVLAPPTPTIEPRILSMQGIQHYLVEKSAALSQA